MSSLLNLVTRFSHPISYTLQPAGFVSSNTTITTLFNNILKKTQKNIKIRFYNNISKTGSNFNKEDLKLLNVNFQPAFKYDVLPCKNLQNDLVTNILKKYALPEINIQTFEDEKFNINNLKEIKNIDDEAKAFLTDIYEVFKLSSYKGTQNTVTNKLVINLLIQIIGLHRYPLKFSIHPQCNLYIGKEQFHVTANPEFVFNRNNVSVIIVEDKHLETVCLDHSKGFGEMQLTAEMFAYISENTRNQYLNNSILEQTIFGIRVISTYFTFYKTVISAKYWKDLYSSYYNVKNPVVIKRWPKGDYPEYGLDIAEPNERQEILEAFASIRQFLLQ